MKRSVLALIIALIGIVSAILLVQTIQKPQPKQLPPVQPASNPYSEAISASGIIEAVYENASIGSPVAGLVEEVYVKVWQQVKKGDPLFKIDSRELQAHLAVDRAKAVVAEAKVVRLQDQLDKLLSVHDKRAVSADDVRTKEHDVAVAIHESTLADEEVHLTETLLERLTITSPIDGTIIQKNIRPGEYLPLDPVNPAIIIGDMSSLQIRASIDEQNASYVIGGAEAIAHPKNRPTEQIPLTFVRIEPYVIPKKSLTGLNDERVDTRVLEVIYTFTPPKHLPLYIGQQVDIYIEAKRL